MESLAYQVYDLVEAMQADAGMPLSVLNVDGGASANDFLMQFQSDVLRTPLRRPGNIETTALGAAYLAGLTTGFWDSTDALLETIYIFAAYWEYSESVVAFIMDFLIDRKSHV